MQQGARTCATARDRIHQVVPFGCSPWGPSPPLPVASPPDREIRDRAIEIGVRSFEPLRTAQCRRSEGHVPPTTSAASDFRDGLLLAVPADRRIRRGMIAGEQESHLVKSPPPRGTSLPRGTGDLGRLFVSSWRGIQEKGRCCNAAKPRSNRRRIRGKPSSSQILPVSMHDATVAGFRTGGSVDGPGGYRGKHRRGW